MRHYRVVTKEGTNTFYVQRRKRFLWWSWWAVIRSFSPYANNGTPLSFDSAVYAREWIKGVQETQRILSLSWKVINEEENIDEEENVDERH